MKPKNAISGVIKSLSSRVEDETAETSEYAIMPVITVPRTTIWMYLEGILFI